MITLHKTTLVVLLAVLTILTGCDQYGLRQKGKELVPGEYGIDPNLKPTGMTYKNLRQHTFSRSGEDYDPVVSRDGKMILFASTRHSPRPDIYLKPIHGPAVTQKTRDPGSDLHPTFSPDGTRFAFTSNRNGNWDIFVMKTHARSTPLQVTRSLSDDIHPNWHPGGSKIVYCSFSEMSNSWEIWVFDFITQEASVVGEGLFPQWSPDGNRIVYQKARNRGTRWYSIWQMDAKGDNVTEIIADNDWAAINPSYSADGSKIVFATVFKSNFSQMKGRYLDGDDIWMVNTDGTNLIRLTTHDQPDWNPSWGPDDRVYFTSKRDGNVNIWSCEPITIDFVPDLRRQMSPSDSVPSDTGMGPGSMNSGDMIQLPKKLTRN